MLGEDDVLLGEDDVLLSEEAVLLGAEDVRTLASRSHDVGRWSGMLGE